MNAIYVVLSFAIGAVVAFFSYRQGICDSQLAQNGEKLGKIVPQKVTKQNLTEEEKKRIEMINRDFQNMMNYKN